MKIKYYSTKIDRWIFLVPGLSVIFFFSILLWGGIKWYIVLIIALPIFGLVSLSFLQISYVIKDDKLGVKREIIWRWYPIEDIIEVRKVKSFTTAPAMSFNRISIKFKRGTTNGSMPLEISPKNRDSFIQDLLKINPNIKIVE